MNEILDIFENGLNQAGQIGSELLSQIGDLKVTVMQYGKFLGILIFGIRMRFLPLGISEILTSHFWRNMNSNIDTIDTKEDEHEQ
jgi:phosphotransferase system  glucose/maltose/N-acetylglucosamine-specific IIC component